MKKLLIVVHSQVKFPMCYLQNQTRMKIYQNRVDDFLVIWNSFHQMDNQTQSIHPGDIS